ncbi:MAG: ABC transporter substrate-binding protein [Lachnospiraceae bacterium]|nr:ABC transporter substrate-binding protein [Lachnospiraceae bacterium]
MKKMKKITGVTSILASAILAAGLLAGCGTAKNASDTSAVSKSESTQDVSTVSKSESSKDTSGASSESVVEEENSSESDESKATADVIRVGSLKGPTSMGLVFLMEENENQTSENHYEFSMATAADELTGQIVKGDLDIALVPANVASILYQKTEGGIKAVDINTLGVLYVVTGDESVTSIADLAGRTVYLTGKGTTPDYVLQYLLKANQVEGADLQYKSESAEVVSVLASDPSAVGVLPQPFATAAGVQNTDLKSVISLTDVWKETPDSNGSQLVTGVTIVRKEFYEQYPEAVEAFLQEHGESVDAINADAETGAELVVKQGIIEKAPVAQKAIPLCNIVCISGEEMKTALDGYLQVLYDQDPVSVGGTLPDQDFYIE